MASNVFSVNVYQIGSQVMTRDAPIKIAFPTTGNTLVDVSGSTTRSLSSGYNVYGLIITNSPGLNGQTWFYTAETQSQLVTLCNA